MAEAMTSLGDPLTQLRQSIASNTPPILSPTEDFAKATHLNFTSPTTASYPLETATRFISSGEPIDLRSVFFAWQNKDAPIPEYLSLTENLNESLVAEGAKVRNLVFVERLDLITWLEGASDTSEYIKPLATDSTAAQAAGSAQVASGTAGGAVSAPGPNAGGKAISERLQEIYNNERRMGDRNSVLRGIKPTDFSHVRKSAEAYMKAARTATKGGTSVPATSNLVSLPKGKPSRRPEPIILLSPSASSLLRMSNIKSFLDEGMYTPPDSSSLAASSHLLYVSRLLPTIDQNRPMRFILVDSPDQFKPDYWSRVVAVFTTGQAWQFKGYKWATPQDLFNHVLGIHMGWRGEQPPDNIKNWGRGVAHLQVDPWRGEGVGRWRDREVVEGLWGKIEESMRRSGWTSAGPRS